MADVVKNVRTSNETRAKEQREQPVSWEPRKKRAGKGQGWKIKRPSNNMRAETGRLPMGGEIKNIGGDILPHIVR